MKLQADSTITYMNSLSQALRDKYKYYYNTERFVGLPAGPICNPGLRALNAAVNPDKNKLFVFLYGQTRSAAILFCRYIG